jgi:hypothetical protein
MAVGHKKGPEQSGPFLSFGKRKSSIHSSPPMNVCLVTKHLHPFSTPELVPAARERAPWYARHFGEGRSGVRGLAVRRW